MRRSITMPLTSAELSRRAKTRRFWKDTVAYRGTVTPVVMPRVIGFAVYGVGVGLLHEVLGWAALGAVPAQFTAAILVLLLVLRTNGGYERWWEARKLWGKIVNQSRNLAIGALAYGPQRDEAWRQHYVRWTAAFAHVSRCSLRGERQVPELEALLNREDVRRIEQAHHMPSFVAAQLAVQLREAVDRGEMSPIAFLAVNKERAELVDHVGGCERILKTPLPLIHTVKLRHFIVLYLLWLPLAAVDTVWWLPGAVTALVAYSLLAIDQISVELENPFSPQNLSHLPLHDICATIEHDLLALLDSSHH